MLWSPLPRAKETLPRRAKDTRRTREVHLAYSRSSSLLLCLMRSPFSSYPYSVDLFFCLDITFSIDIHQCCTIQRRTLSYEHHDAGREDIGFHPGSSLSHRPPCRCFLIKRRYATSDRGGAE